MKPVINNKKFRVFGVVVGLLILLFLTINSVGFVRAEVVERGDVYPDVGEWVNKVDTAVLQQINAGHEAEFIVLLNEQADVSAAAALRTKEEKGQFVFEHLTAVAEFSQALIRDYLDARKIPYQSFWINNMLLVQGDAAVVEALASRADVVRVMANTAVAFDEPVAVADDDQTLSPSAVEWGIAKINADDVWAMGYTGQGVVIAGQDTGYDWDHVALKSMYRGWDSDSSTADHNYNWHDAIHIGSSTGNSCGYDLQQPCDDHGHGTHTMGTMIGDDGGSNQIGVAPGSAWIACRNMDSGNGTPATYAECFEWFIAPTDLDGSNPDPSKSPHVINNSWSCPTSEGCIDPVILKTVVENVRVAGIFVAVSAGNSGPSCSSVLTPAAIYDASFSIGATSSIDTIASFSARGPVTVDGSDRFKPDVSAPGVSVRSSRPGDLYGNSSGTSMASPHVAGAVALLISADPSLAGQIDKIEQILRNTAVPLTSAQTCGGLPGSESPNHTFGYGRIDVLAAVNYALAPPDAVAPSVEMSLYRNIPVLDWDNDRANCQYGVFRSDNTPYFEPLPSSHLATLWADTTSFTDYSLPNTVGDPQINAFYQVQGLNCGVDTAVSQTIGEFDFAISSGLP